MTQVPGAVAAGTSGGRVMNWFWHALWIALVVIPVTILWISCVIDLFMRRDLSGWAKLAWLVGILVVPLFGALAYLLFRPSVAMFGGEGVVAGTDVYPGGGSTAEELAKLDDLRGRGVINEQEFASQKARLLGSGTW
jgi:Phospholipase_D-nuclease N-terminal/Short C-terminal domain